MPGGLCRIYGPPTVCKGYLCVTATKVSTACIYLLYGLLQTCKPKMVMKDTQYAYVYATFVRGAIPWSARGVAKAEILAKGFYASTYQELCLGHTGPRHCAEG